MRSIRSEDEILAKWKGEVDKPVVSICCITYNHELYIEDALEGFLIQETDFPFEILIHDDASTDGTADIIREYEAKYPKLMKPIYQVENQYSKLPSISPRFLFPIANGKYIAMCEGDDCWIDKEKLQKQVVFLESNKEYIACYHNSKIIDEIDRVINDELISAPKDYQENDLLSASAFITVHSVMFRNVIKFKDEFNTLPFGDMMLWHLFGHYGKVKYLPDIEYAMYRWHEEGVWSSLDAITKLRKTLLARKVIRTKLASNLGAAKMLDAGTSAYVQNNLTGALKAHSFKLYWQLAVYLFKYEYLPKHRIVLWVLLSLYAFIGYQFFNALRFFKVIYESR